MTAKERIERAGYNNGLVFIMLSVAKLIAKDVEDDLRTLGMEYNNTEKWLINQAANKQKEVYDRISVLETTLFNSKPEDDILDDVGYVYDMMNLLLDRVGSNEQKMIQARALIFNIKSELNIYK